MLSRDWIVTPRGTLNLESVSAAGTGIRVAATQGASTESVVRAATELSNRLAEAIAQSDSEAAPNPSAVLAVLAAREHRLSDLPPGVTLEHLRVLDADGFIEALAYAWHSESLDKGRTHRLMPRPLSIPWTSPVHNQRLIGDWDTLHKQAIADPPIAAAIRVSEKGKAELARLALRWPVREQTQRLGSGLARFEKEEPTPWQDRVRPCVREAAGAYQHAIDADPALARESVKVVHGWLVKHPPTDEWTVPSLASFRRYISDARGAGWKCRMPTTESPSGIVGVEQV